MATEFSVPEGFDPPEITTEQLIDGSWQKIEKEYIERLANLAKTQSSSELTGKVIRFPRGDGYAQYMVWQTKPLQLIWLDLGDAWSVEPALIRGLNLADVKEMVLREEKLAELFSKNK